MVNFTMLVRNRMRLTTQALDSLGWDGLEYDKTNMWVTVHCDTTDDSVVDEVMGLVTPKHGYVTRSLQSEGTGIARNTVIADSQRMFGRGKYLYLSDNDVFFKPGWLDALVQCYEIAWREGFRVLGAYNHPYHQPVSKINVCLYGNPEKATHAIHEVHALALQSMLMRWEVWDKYGPFCQTPPGKVCQSEDVDFTNKIKADGFKLGVVSPALIVNTGITNSFGEKIPGWELVKAQCPEGVICE